MGSIVSRSSHTLFWNPPEHLSEAYFPYKPPPMSQNNEVQLTSTPIIKNPHVSMRQLLVRSGIKYKKRSATYQVQKEVQLTSNPQSITHINVAVEHKGFDFLSNLVANMGKNLLAENISDSFYSLLNQK